MPYVCVLRKETKCVCVCVFSLDRMAKWKLHTLNPQCFCERHPKSAIRYTRVRYGMHMLGKQSGEKESVCACVCGWHNKVCMHNTAS